MHQQTIDDAKTLGSAAVELHTGAWANAWLSNHQQKNEVNQAAVDQELARLETAAEHCANIGMRCHAGHGITYHNVRELLHLKDLRELNIGNTIVSKSIMVGMERAVREMRNLIAAGPIIK